MADRAYTWREIEELRTILRLMEFDWTWSAHVNECVGVGTGAKDKYGSPYPLTYEHERKLEMQLQSLLMGSVNPLEMYDIRDEILRTRQKKLEEWQNR